MSGIPKLGEIGIERYAVVGEIVEFVGEVIELGVDAFELVENLAMLLL